MHREVVLNWHSLTTVLAPRRGAHKQEQADCALIKNSGLFDSAWYLAQFSTTAKSRLDPILDYVRRGARDGRNPSPLFDTEWYLSQYPEVQETGLNPLVHYLLQGAAAGYEPSPFFDTQRYLSQHTSLGSTNALAHYMRNGWYQGALTFDPARLLCNTKVAVVVHLFYPDLWREIVAWLRNIPIKFDLFVSVPRENAGALGALVLRDYPQAQVLQVPNVGRDVGAFLAVLPKVLAGNYSVLCKLHSKKGSAYPNAWRNLLLRGLLANKMLVTRILHAFARDPDLALVGAREVYLSGMTNTKQNGATIKELTQLLYPGQSIPGNWGFFAGTMFWARPDFLRPFTQCGDHMLSFETDNTKNDGQLAHALERVFGMLATVGGKHIGLTEIAGVLPLDGTIHLTPAPGHPWEGGFLQVLKGHAVTLRTRLPIRRKSARHGGGKSRTSKRKQRVLEPSQISADTGNWRKRASARFPALSRQIRRILKLVRWTATLQIVPRLHDFFIKRLQARMVASSPLFDRAWYLESYPDVLAANVDPALHYVTKGAAEYRDPSPRFDTAWYLAYYSDIAATGPNPLVHYLRHGVKEGRHARPSEIVVGEVTDAALLCRKRPCASGEITLFVTHSPDGKLKPHVRHYLEALRRHGMSPVLIVAADVEFGELDSDLLALVDGFYVRQNVGYDFAAWAHIFRKNPQLLCADILYLINDSTVGPLNEQKFEQLLRRVRSSRSDVIGLTDSYERGWHIQSYFIALKATALSSTALRAFMEKIKNLRAKNDVVFAYEIRFAAALRAAGLSCEVLFPRTFPAGKAYNPSLLDWPALIGSGMPFIKLAALRNSSDRSRSTDWRKVLHSEGFDYHIAERALASQP
jgi:lipopolysaccharide biosynthesis protein